MEQEKMTVRGVEFKMLDRYFQKKNTKRSILAQDYEEMQLNFHDRVAGVINEISLPSDFIIKKCASDACGISINEFDSKSRKREVVLARQIAMTYLQANDVGKIYSLEKIGDLFGKKDHATVLHAGRQIQALCESNNVQALTYVSRFIEFLKAENSRYPTRMMPIQRTQLKKRKL
jgi:hypothetical protein